MSETKVRGLPTKQVHLVNTVQVLLRLDCHPGMKCQSLRKVRGLPCRRTVPHRVSGPE